jgi:hypothetical protein
VLEANVQAGTPLPATDWTTLGVVTLTDVRPGFPQVAAFDLPATVLPVPASLAGQSHFCSLVLVHSASDPYTNTERVVDTLIVADRKVAQKNLHIVQFVGMPPPPDATTGTWARLDIGGHLFLRRTKDSRIDLEIDARDFDGRLAFVGPPGLIGRDTIKAAGLSARPRAQLTAWLKRHRADAVRLQREGKLSVRSDPAARRHDAGAEIATPRHRGSEGTPLTELPITPGSTQTIFIRIDPPAKAKPGSNGDSRSCSATAGLVMSRAAPRTSSKSTSRSRPLPRDLSTTRSQRRFRRTHGVVEHAWVPICPLVPRVRATRRILLLASRAWPDLSCAQWTAWLEPGTATTETRKTSWADRGPCSPLADP